MAYRIVFCGIVSIVLRALSAKESDRSDPYDEAQVWRTPLLTQQEFESFQKLKAGEEISVWDMNKERVDYLVYKEQQMKILRSLEKRNLKHSVLISNVKQKIEDSKVEDITWTDSSLRIGHRLNFQSYPSMQILDEYLDYLKENFPSSLRLYSIGNSVENRTIKMLHISNGDPSNKAIVLIAGQHSREWIGITSALYIANNILTKFDKQPAYMKNKDWYIVPLLNPDGYVYTQTKDRLWRKNRRKNSKSKCYGVDINRNYPKNWQIYGITQTKACEEDYAGPFALSEPESLALLNMLDSIGPKVPSAFVDLHSYGQMIMYPWGDKGKPSEYKAYLESTAKTMKSAIFNATGRKYKYGTPSELLYPVSGTAIDWFHSKGIPLSYAIESRDSGTHGFLLPASQIEDTGKELLGAVRALSKTLTPAIKMRDGSDRRWF